MKTSLCILLVVFEIGVMQAGTISGTATCRGNVKPCNAVVYAARVTKQKVPPPSAPVVLDQVNLTFTPHVLPVLVGTTVAFPNNDDVPHNVFSPSPSKIFNLGIYPKGASRQVTFDQPGEVLLLCNIHPHMSAYVLVLEEPYFTTSADDGSFRLKNLPPGKYRMTTWHERYKPVSREVEVKGKERISLTMELNERR